MKPSMGLHEPSLGTSGGRIARTGSKAQCRSDFRRTTSFGQFAPSRTQATKNTLRTILTKTGWSSREIKAIRGVFRALSGSRSSKT